MKPKASQADALSLMPTPPKLAETPYQGRSMNTNSAIADTPAIISPKLTFDVSTLPPSPLARVRPRHSNLPHKCRGPVQRPTS